MKKFLSLVLALVMTMSLVTISAGAKDFTDSADINYDEAVDVMSALEIIDGYAGGDFQPQGTLTRGAAAKIIACMMLGKTTAESLGNQAAPFKDVPAGSTFAGYIAYCVETGIVDGYADGTFRPSNKLTGFAFLKMLLTAMGYDSAIEGFTGTNWTVNVARLAIENDLTDGNDDFVGTELATREEACLYALNTIKATLVEYESKGNTITINGAVISQGATAAKPVTSKVVSDQTINDDKTVNDEYYTVEFGEKYMPKLVLTGDEDNFMRPANTWYYKSELIGTYADEPDLTYTTKVSASQMYLDLGISKIDSQGRSTNQDNLPKAVYVNGVKDATQSTYEIKKSNTNDKFGGQGVLTEVYTSSNKVTIVEIHSYVGDVVSKTAATTSKDAYITITARGTNNTFPSGNFDTEDFAMDDVVVYTYSKKIVSGAAAGIQTVAKAESATGTLTGYTTGDSATVGGTTYKYNVNVATEADRPSVNTEVTVYMDAYGNAIDIDGKTSTQYAYILNWNAGTGVYADGTAAKLLLTDGTVVDATLTDAKDGSATGNATDAKWETGEFVSYTINNAGKYTLKALSQAVENAGDGVTIENGSYVITDVAGKSAGNALTANGDTIFLVKTKDADGNAVYTAYNGIKNVPTIKLTGTTVSAAYSKSATKLATVVYVDTTAATTSSVSNPTSDVIFVKGDTTKAPSYTYGIGSYYKYDSVVNGQLMTGDNQIMIATAVNGVNGVNELKSISGIAGQGTAAYGLYDQIYKDANNVYSLGISDNVIYGVGAYKESNTVIGILNVAAVGGKTNGGAPVGTYAYYNVASGATLTVVDTNGNIAEVTAASAVINDTNDRVWFKLNAANEITSIYVVKVEGGEFSALTNKVVGGADAAATGVYQFCLTQNGTYTATLENVLYGATVYVKSFNNETLVSTLPGWQQVQAPSSPSTPGIYSFTMPAKAVTSADFTVKYAVTAAESGDTNNVYTVTADKAWAAAGETVTISVAYNGTTTTKLNVAVATDNADTVTGTPMTFVDQTAATKTATFTMPAKAVTATATANT